MRKYSASKKETTKKPDFVLIQDHRLRLSTIKRYSPGKTTLKDQMYCINIYFSVNKMNEKISVRYKKIRDRDKDIKRLDILTGAYDSINLQ